MSLTEVVWHLVEHLGGTAGRVGKVADLGSNFPGLKGKGRHCNGGVNCAEWLFQ